MDLNKNAFKSINSAYLLSEVFDAKCCNFENKIFLGTRPFALYLSMPKVRF